MQILQNYINGDLCKPRNAMYLDNYNPAKGEVYSQIPDSDTEDVESAVLAAEKAFSYWSNLPKNERAKFLFKIADLIESNLENLAKAESIDSGKPLSLARKVDIPRARDNFRFFASAIMHFASEAYDMENTAINYTLRSPIGIVACISPWNLPLYLFTWKIAPALASGNCVLAKPSEVTPMTAFLLSQICQEVGLPAGVLNIVHGLGDKVGSAMVKHPQVKAISFTGSTRVGREIARAASPQFKKISLEMGGKNPNIIFADCDYAQMLDTTLRSSFANQGQICLCGSRIFVEKALYEQFKHDFVKKTKKLTVANPASEEANLGAVASKQHLEKILFYIDLAQKEKGKILTGGKQVYLEGECQNGYFVTPTIIENLAYDCRTNQEEIFGPIVSIMPFESNEEVLKYANSTEYGLSATIWTKDLNKAHRLAQNLEAGIVWVNCWLLRDLRTPFGGVKSSGVGREGGWEALRFFTEAKNVCIKF